jgi:probable F420-dependent oxidoreductase
VKFGFSLLGLSLRWYPEVARAAEAAGFDSIWVQDHVVFPAQMPSEYPYSENGDPGFDARTPLIDPWIALTSVANATQDVGLATNVYVAALRAPLVTARAAVTLDRLSGGRLSLGVGVGWLRPEYEALGVTWAGRGRRLDEILTILRRVWSEDTISHEGEFYRFSEICFEPKPLRRRSIPLPIGGESPAAMRRAARCGDGWLLAWLGTPAEVAAKLDGIQRLRAEYGREAQPFEVGGSARMHASLQDLRAYRDAGLDRVIVDAADSRSAQEAVAAIDDYRKSVLERL